MIKIFPTLSLIFISHEKHNYSANDAEKVSCQQPHDENRSMNTCERKEKLNHSNYIY